jgi:hypothetical protein
LILKKRRKKTQPHATKLVDAGMDGVMDGVIRPPLSFLVTNKIKDQKIFQTTITKDKKMKKIKKTTAFNFSLAFACIVFVGASPLQAGIRTNPRRLSNVQFSKKPGIPTPNLKENLIVPIVIGAKQDAKTVANSSLAKKAYAAQSAKSSSDNPCIQWQQVLNPLTKSLSLMCTAFEK